jgi:LysR family transcriptional regulator (chromosome initiation inhibitor)
MDYRLFASPAFIKRWFSSGFLPEEVSSAPALVFNRKDDLHNKLFAQAMGKTPRPLPAHYIPSSEKFVNFIAAGFAYGMLPDQQSRALEETGGIVDLAPGCVVTVKLYWHCWNLESRLLKKLTRMLVGNAGRLLEK